MSAYRFHNFTEYSEYQQHEGKTMTILRMLSNEEDAVPPSPGDQLFEARTDDGAIIHVYACECVPERRA